MEQSLDPELYQIGYAGQDAIKESFENRDYDLERVKQFIIDFRTLRRLQFDSVRAPLELLKMGGFSESRVLRDVLKVMIDKVKRDINTLSHEKLESLLEKSFTYLTVPQLAPIPIAVLEHMNVVDPSIWKQIVDNGLSEAPYIDLPLSIKKRIWSFEPKALDHEIEALLDRLPEAPPSESIEEFVVKQDRHKLRSANQMLGDLLRMLEGMGENEVLQVIEKMIERASVEQTASKHISIANFYHDLLLRLPSVVVSGPNMISLRKMARFLASVPSYELDIDSHLLKSIRESLLRETPSSSVALLLGSTYTRDFLAEQLVFSLIHRRGPINDWNDTTILESATSHLKADPHIEDLTYLNLCNMKSAGIVSGSDRVAEAEVDEPFQLFFQLMMDEIHADIVAHHDSYYSANVGLPNVQLVDAVQKGKLQRRVMSSYCLQQFIHRNMVSLSRYRLILEDVLRAADQTTELREVALAHQLILRIINS
ncbi:hypothetical protein BWQ96_02005 [Gracilariopsis chorda]|uniref:Negative elongation factor B n=1 Tax=Gracilariopsis chorda TaxID=448386 RepID=A0A2V3J167_9FLOR|nr:hypothetical protein BWQ96_02005 [Gracilariopsis chorda]|eukprot:PXF48053.1 hypothetical protein BWQ96_02005 [Gracilariopsis chorda]